mgnify:CR=1 FL=1
MLSPVVCIILQSVINACNEYSKIYSGTHLITMFAGLVFTGKIFNELKNIRKVDVTNLSNGIYFLKITTENESYITKFIKN